MTGKFRGRYPRAMSVRLTREQQAELDRLSQEFGVSRAQLLREAIDLGLKADGEASSQGPRRDGTRRSQSGERGGLNRKG